MIDYKIVVPTYQRYTFVKEKTLSFLERQNIPKENIYIFVANKEEDKKYLEELRGIGQQRNYIEQEYFDEGTYIVSMDDDIEDVMIKNTGNKLKSVHNFYEDIILKGYDEMKKNKAYVWGIYAAANPFFMKYRVYTNLCYIIASTYGFISQKNKELIRTENENNVEKGIQAIAEEWPQYCTKYYRKDGTPELRLRDKTKKRKNKPIIEKDLDKPWIIL